MLYLKNSSCNINFDLVSYTYCDLFDGFYVDYYLNMLTWAYQRGYVKQRTINYTDQDEVKIV